MAGRSLAPHPLRYAGLLIALLIVACDPGEPKFKSTDITGADYGRSIALADHTGRARTLEDFRGQVVVVFFGFAQCPDICPTTLAELAQVMKQLGPEADRVQVLLITLDPERDAPAVLARYVTAFNPKFLGLHGNAEAIRRTAKEFKVFYEKRPTDASGAYSIDHSAQSYVIDPKGRLRLFVRHSRISTDLADDIRALLREK